MWVAGQRLIGCRQVCFLSGGSLMSTHGNQTTDLCHNTAAGRKASISHHSPLTLYPAVAHVAFKASGGVGKSQIPVSKNTFSLLYRL